MPHDGNLLRRAAIQRNRLVSVASLSTLDKYRELGIQVALRGHGGEIARMQWAYELTCNRLILACKTQPELKGQLFRQMCCGLSDDDLDALLAPQLANAMRGAARTSMDEAFA